MLGFTYMATVATFPSAIFFLGAGILTSSLIAISFVRLPKETTDDLESLAAVPEADPARTQEDELVDTEIPTIVVEAVNSKPSSPRVDA